MLAVLFAATSCSDDDNDNTQVYKNADLKGLWVANGSGTLIGGLENSIVSDLILKSIRETYGENPQTINGKYLAYYFDGENAGAKGVASSLNGKTIEQEGRSDISYVVEKDVLSVSSWVDGELNVEMIKFSMYDNSQLRFIYDLTQYYNKKETIQKLLDDAGVTGIDAGTIKVTNVQFSISFMKTADEI